MKNAKFTFTQFASASKLKPEVLMLAMQSFNIIWDMEERDGFEINFSFTNEDFDKAISEPTLAPGSLLTIKYDDGDTTATLLDGTIMEMEVGAGSPTQEKRQLREDWENTKPNSSAKEEEGEKSYELAKLNLNVMTLKGLGAVEKLEETKKVGKFPNKNRKQIIDGILGAQGSFTSKAFTPDDTPAEDEKVLTQNSQTDFDFIKYLGGYSGFILCAVPDKSELYWGSIKDLYTSTTSKTLVVNAPYMKSASFKTRPSKEVKAKGAVLEDGQDEASDVGGTSNDVFVNVQNLTKTEAATLIAAVGEYTKMKTIEITATVDVLKYGAFVVPPCKAEVYGAGATFNGKYVVTRITHQVAIGNMASGGDANTITQIIVLNPELT